MVGKKRQNAVPLVKNLPQIGEDSDNGIYGIAATIIKYYSSNHLPLLEIQKKKKLMQNCEERQLYK